MGSGSPFRPNRDPAQFEDPDVLDIRRNPNRHIAFGSGVHLCLGSTLARMEAAIAIGDLIKTYASIEPTVDDGDLEWNQALFLRGMKSFPVAVS